MSGDRGDPSTLSIAPGTLERGGASANALAPPTLPDVSPDLTSPLFPSTTPPAGPLAPTGARPPALAAATGDGAGGAGYAGPTTLMNAVGANQDLYDRWRDYLIRRESGGRYDLLPNGDRHSPIGLAGQTRQGYMGLYQMGSDEIIKAAKDLGIPVPSQDEFLNSLSLQEKLHERYQIDHHNALMNNPQYANGDARTRLAMLTGAHLGGIGGVQSWQQGGGPHGQGYVDANGTSVGSYIVGSYNAMGGTGTITPIKLASSRGGQPTPLTPYGPGTGRTEPQDAAAADQPTTPTTPPPTSLGQPPGPLGMSGLMALALGLGAGRFKTASIAYDPWNIQQGYERGQQRYDLSQLSQLGSYTTRVGRKVAGPVEY